MKKDEQYFPFERTMINDDNVSDLIESLGPKGFGTYVLILAELRYGSDYRCHMSALKGMARRCKISTKILEKVLAGFRLFEFSNEGNDMVISSPYLDRVMTKYDRKMKRIAEGRAKGYDNSTRGADGKFTAYSGALDKTKLDKKETTTTVVGKTAAEAEDWEIYLDEAVKDEAWLEILAMNSGISPLFVKHREFVIEAFRQHALLQGSGAGLHSVRDVKSYFANFLRQGTLTQNRIATQLAALEEQYRQTSPYRFESIDPQTGERSYFDNPIPPDAPPRPNNNAVWSEDLKCWI